MDARGSNCTGEVIDVAKSVRKNPDGKGYKVGDRKASSKEKAKAIKAGAKKGGKKSPSK